MLAHTSSHQLVDRTKLEPWRKLLLDAADGIVSRGHTKGALVDASGAMCAIGAVTWADCGSSFSRSADAQKACLLLYYRVGVIQHWNDAPERTAAEVIDVMRTCAMKGLS